MSYNSDEYNSGKRNIVLFALILVSLMLTMTGMCFYYSSHSSKPVETVLSGTDHSDDGYYVELVDTKGGWENSDKTALQKYGTQYDGSLVNDTNKTIDGWQLVFKAPAGSYIEDRWGFDYTESNGVFTIRQADYNLEPIAAHKSQTFGFTMYSTEPLTFEWFDLTAMEEGVIYQETWFWILAVLMFTILVILLTNIFSYAHFKRLETRYRIMNEITDQALRTFARTIDAKDDYTFGHSYRVAVYARKIAKNMGLSADEQENIYYIGLLHDIGKIGIPDAILNKPGKLNDEEWEQIKTHVNVGGNILAEFSSIPGIQDGARYHHERWDGSGYGSGISGEDIPLYARIIGVADSYDAMSSARCYRPALSEEVILAEFEKGAGKQFDPKIAKIMIDIIKKEGVVRPEEED